jgi:prepilin-type N-terminal cleavage/methylation domain-containing protein
MIRRTGTPVVAGGDVCSFRLGVLGAADGAVRRITRRSNLRQPQPYRALRQPVQGFSLVELLLVVAFLGILAAVAVPTAGKMIRRARAFGSLASIRQVFAVARLQAIRRGVNVVVLVTLTPEGLIQLHTFQDRANDFTAPLPADEQAAAGNGRQDTGTFATSPATDEPTLGDTTLPAAVRLWKEGDVQDSLGTGMSFDTYNGDATLADRVIFLPSGGVVPPQDAGTSGPPTATGGRGLYFADFSGQNYFRVTVENDLTGKIRVDKYQDGLGYVNSGWTWR